MTFQIVHNLQTSGRSTQELTAQLHQDVRAACISTGVMTVFVHHTSASVMICENADPQVLRDMEAWLARASPDGDRLFRHTDEGPDDMPAHVRSVLTGMSVSIPVIDGRLALGTWQGVFLYEHRLAPHRRRVSVTIVGA